MVKYKQDESCVLYRFNKVLHMHETTEGKLASAIKYTSISTCKHEIVYVNIYQINTL